VSNPGSPSLPRPFTTSRPWFGDVVLIVFLCAQVLDGALTYLGVVSFGIREGNPLIEHYMHAIGLGPSLTAAKLVAAGCAIVLHVLTFHRMLAVLTLVYLSFAIVPWTLVLVLSH
jgi:hypothetical protein